MKRKAKRSKEDQQRYWGEWLSRSIANSGNTQSELAAYADVSNPQVTRWKNGQVPSTEACQRIADFFEVERLRLAVTTGRITAEVAGVDKLPLPDDSMQRMTERQQIQEAVTKKLSRDTDRQVLLLALEALKARDNLDDVATEQEKLSEAITHIEETVGALRQLLTGS